MEDDDDEVVVVVVILVDVNSDKAWPMTDVDGGTTVAVPRTRRGRSKYTR